MCKNMSVCRLCLDYTHTSIEDLILNNPLYHIQIKLLLPEIDMDLTPMYGLCRQCSNSLEASYTFRNKCIQTEAFITEYLRNCESSTVDLNLLKHPSVECVLLSHSNGATTVNYEKIESGIDEDWQEEVDNSKEVINDSQGVENESDANFDETDTVTPTFTCNLCNIVFQDEGMFQKHSKICNTASECKTEEPSVNIGESENLKSCSDNIQTSLTQYKYTIKSIHSAIKFSKSVHGENAEHAIEEYICKLCNRKYSTMYRIQIHLCSHSRKEHLKKASEQAAHSETKLLACSLCDRLFTRKEALLCHKEIHKANNYECSICVKNYSNKHALKRHVYNVHSKKHICELCGRSCGTKAALTEHIRTHTGERPYRCEMCGKGFAQKSTLNTHIKCLHSEERPFQCDICQKTFNCKGTLGKHIITHTDHSVRNFICSIENCGKSFYSKLLLQSHVLQHKYKTMLKHKCTVCEKAFESTKKLRRHTMCHTGEKPFECDICQKGFSRKDNLKIHIKSHQPKENRGVKGNER